MTRLISCYLSLYILSILHHGVCHTSRTRNAVRYFICLLLVRASSLEGNWLNTVQKNLSPGSGISSLVTTRRASRRAAPPKPVSADVAMLRCYDAELRAPEQNEEEKEESSDTAANNDAEETKEEKGQRGQIRRGTREGQERD